MAIVPIRNQAALAVPGLFGLASNQGPREVDNGPAQPVYDLTRLAELASGKGSAQGYVELFNAMTHVGAGDVFAVLTVDDAVGIVGNVSKDLAWLVNVAAVEDTDGIASEVLAAIVYPASPAIPLSRLYTVMHSTVFANLPTASAGVQPAVPTLLFQGPVLLPRGTIIRVASTASGAGDITVACLFWVGPIGSRPPGA